jgi:uncharacterized protein (TIGR03437 family)
LLLNANPANGGLIQAAPASADGYYNAGSTIQVTANPIGGFHFNGFSGDVEGLTNPVSIVMSAPRVVAANFARPSPGGGGGSGGGTTTPGSGGTGTPAVTQTNAGTIPDSSQGQVGEPFDYNVCPDVTGAPPLPNLTFVFTPPPGLPAGMTMSPSGRLTGTPEAPGNYVLEIPGRWILANNQTQAVYTFTCRVTFNVRGQASGLSVEGGNASFVFLEASTATATRVFRVTNRSERARSFSVSATADDGSGWLQASGGGTIPPFGWSTFTVSAAPSGLPGGVYRGTVLVSGPEGSTERLDVGSLMTITPAEQTMIVSQSGMTFVMEEGNSASVVKNFQVLKTGTSPLPFTLQTSTLSGGDWLRTLTVSGVVTGNVAANIGVTVNPPGLGPGTYYGQIEVRSGAAANSPQLVGVVLRIVPATEDPPPVVSPHGILFVDGRADSQAPQYISITNVSKKQLSFSTGIGFEDSSVPNWFTVSAPVSTMSPGQTVFVQITRDGGVRLPTGIARGRVTLRFATGFVGRVEIVGLTPPGALPAGNKKPEARAAAGCTPSRLIPVFITLGSGFNATAAWPSALEIRTVDDCGDSLVEGSTTINFSNGDPPLGMIHVGEGRWSGTWLPRAGAQNVVLTATAQGPERSTLRGTAQIGGAAATNGEAPAVRVGGVVSAASLKTAPVAPGSYVSILGQALATGLSTAPGAPYPTDLSGTQVLLGSRRLLLEYVSDGRVNALIPYELTPNVTQQLVVRRGSTYSVPETIVIAAAQPAIFTRAGTGTGEGSVTVMRDGLETPVSADNPAAPGEVITIYCAGLGSVTPNVPAGSTTPSDVRVTAVKAPTVEIGGARAEVQFAGLAPGLVGVYIVQATVPPGLSGAVSMTITTSGQTSAPATVAIR